MTVESSLTGKNMAVFGGGQGWGAKIAQTGERLGSAIGIVEKYTPDEDRDRFVDAADIVFLATPDTKIQGIIIAMRDNLRGKCVLDCATRKRLFQEELVALSDNASVCSTHPMVRSETPPRGQNALIMPVGENAQGATEVAESIFGELGMRLRHLDFSCHDDIATIKQLLPHLIQRAMADTMGQILSENDLSLDSAKGMASANSEMTDMAMGRVAIQRPDVSAGIVSESLQTPIGEHILDVLLGSLTRIAALKLDREALAANFADSADILDPSGLWREQMGNATDMQVEAMGNFGMSSMILEVQNDEPGLLSNIGNMFASLGLNMNAIHSHAIERKNDQGVRFNIGVSNKDVPWDQIESACKEQGWKLTRMKK